MLWQKPHPAAQLPYPFQHIYDKNILLIIAPPFQSLLHEVDLHPRLELRTTNIVTRAPPTPVFCNNANNVDKRSTQPGNNIIASS